MKKILIAVGMVFIASSCSHGLMRGSVAMKMDSKTAHVCLGENDVKVGDELRFYINRCSTTGGSADLSGDLTECELKELGSGTVSKLLSDHYSEVRTDGSFTFKEGTLVQKQ